MFEDLFRNPLHLWLLLMIVFVVFGAGKLPEAAAGLGKSIKEFKKEVKSEDGSHASAATPPAPVVVASSGVLCPSCGSSQSRADARFCEECGVDLRAFAATAPACPSCGAITTPAARFCNECGKPIAQALAPAAN